MSDSRSWFGHRKDRPAEALEAAEAAVPLGSVAAAVAEHADRIADLEQRVGELERGVESVLQALQLHPPAPTLKPTDSIDADAALVQRVWSASPLAARLAFGRAIVPSEHPLQASLKEAVSLLELCGRHEDLQAWIDAYPALFADSAAQLRPRLPVGASDVEALAVGLLGTMGDLLDRHVSALGIEWIAPEPGAVVSDLCEVVGEEASSSGPPGSIARLRRPGFRRLGAVVLPAQVTRTCAAPPPPPDAVAAAEPAALSDAAIRPPHVLAREEPDPVRWPDWLRVLQRARLSAGSPVVHTLMEGLTQVVAGGVKDMSEEAVLQALGPLVPLLGPASAGVLEEISGEWLEAFRGVRPELVSWLEQEAGVQVHWPSERASFDPRSMEAVGTRRTAHPHEDGSVARVDRVGLTRDGQVLVRARVVRYEVGGDG